MKRHLVCCCAIAPLVGILLSSSALPARADEGGCKVLLDALRREIDTPTHIYSTETAAYRGGKARSSEMVYEYENVRAPAGVK